MCQAKVVGRCPLNRALTSPLHSLSPAAVQDFESLHSKRPLNWPKKQIGDGGLCSNSWWEYETKVVPIAQSLPLALAPFFTSLLEYATLIGCSAFLQLWNA